MITWPDLKLPPINLYSLPWWIETPAGVLNVNPDRLLRQKRVKKQLTLLRKHYNELVRSR